MPNPDTHRRRHPLLLLRFVLLASASLAVARAQATDAVALKRLSLEDLLNVEVTSVSRYSEHLMNAAASVQVISSTDITRSTALTLPQLMRLADNLNVAQKNPHDWAISARGFNANVGDKMLVLIDGRTVYTPLFAGVFWNAQDYLLEDIDRIEAISGPGGTLWGANAVNGVINVTTKSAKNTQGLYLQATGGSFEQGVLAGRYGGTLAPNVYYRVYGKVLDETDAILAAGGKAHDAWTQRQAGFRIDAHPAGDTRYTVQGDIYSGDLEIQTGNTARIAGGNLLGRVTHTLANDSEWELQAYVDRTHLADPIQATPFGPAGFLRDDLDTYDVDFQHNLRLADRHHLVWGAGYRLIVDDDRSAPSMGFLPPRDTKSLFSGFVQDEFAATDTLAVIAGSKIEHNGYTGWEAEPNIRVRWNATPRNTVWAAISRAVRMPSRFDRGLAEAAPPYRTVISGGADFQAETLIAYELGYRTLIGTQTGFSATAFYQDYGRLRGLEPTPVTTLPLVYHNTSEGHTYGLELSADYDVIPSWRLHAGYALLREHLRVKPGRIDFFNTLDETEDPENQLSLRSSVDLPKRVQWDAQLRWVDKLSVNSGGRPATVPSYWELDTRLGWRLNDATRLSVGGTNLLHAHHPEYGAPSPEREEVRRYVYAKVEWEW
jgi:iron complex outermembrane receptor protein